MKDTLNIIIPVYNGERFIAETLNSILKQTFSDYKIIIVNDGSTDRTYKIVLNYVSKYPNKIKIINHKKNLGLSAARNTGATFKPSSKSKYITFHDCDDISEPKKYEEIIKYLKENNLDGCGCLGYYFKDKFNGPSTVLHGHPNIETEYQNIFETFHKVNHFIVSSVVMKREVFDNLNGFDCNLTGCQDYDFWSRALISGYKFANLPKFLHYIRLHNSSMCKTSSKVMSYEEKHIRVKYAEFINKNKIINKSFDLDKFISELDKKNKDDKHIINKKLNIGLILIATNNYINFFNQLYLSVKKYFLKSYNVEIFLFTDCTNKKFPANVHVINTLHKPWPFMTLLRYKLIWNNRACFENMDYLFYCDVDMKFVNTVEEEILSDLVATLHPGFYMKTFFPFEQNYRSTAFIKNKKLVKEYFAGGFQGGIKDIYLDAANILSKRIDIDLNKNIIAVWHDETHWNKYLLENPPTLKLSPSYCYPETGYDHLKMKKKLVALNKDHKKLRGQK